MPPLTDEQKQIVTFGHPNRLLAEKPWIPISPAIAVSRDIAQRWYHWHTLYAPLIREAKVKRP